MFIADALSCSYRLMTDDAKHESSAVHALQEVHHTDGLSAGFSIEGGTQRLIAAYFRIYSRLLCV